jgi:NAD-dependent dihydropyrimidine dehydrogenase PreA subunit
MKRTIIEIDEALCNGCGACVTGCHEGALQMIDGKARIISDLFCDGLGACIGECPVGAIQLIEREAEPYDEIKTIINMIPKGENTILAHLKHLKEHGETGYLKQAVGYLREQGIQVDFAAVHNTPSADANPGCGGGCPGSTERTFTTVASAKATPSFKMAPSESPTSQLRQWPVQLHLLNPQASYFQQADVVLAADCVAFSYADFHNRFLAGKTLAIACPKLDSNKEVYVEKLKTMIQLSHINTLTVIIMEVPCCGGLYQLAAKAVAESGVKIPLKLVVIGVQGNIIKEEWV